MDFPIADLMDQDSCYQKLLGLLHPAGLACPVCETADHLRAHLPGLRHRLQGLAAKAAADQMPLTDAEVEADELYQNAGEKRHAPRRPRRPAAAPGQQPARPRVLGHRPAAGGGGGRP